MQGDGGTIQLHAPPTNDELIEIYRQTGNAEDFERIVRRFAALVLSECRRVTNNAHDAEDASQLVFLALAMEIKSGTDIRRLSPWLQRVARRQALKIVRSKTRRKRREDAVSRQELQPHNGDAPLDAVVTSGIVRDAIDELPERYRLPVILHYFGGLDLNRIAAELKLKRPAVATRLHRGRKMLEGHLAKRGMRLENGTLASLLAILVPAGVVEGIMAASGGMKVPAQMHAAATLPTVIGNTLRALAVTAVRRPIAVAAITASLACCGSGMAWAIRTGAIDVRKFMHLDVQQIFHRALPQAPTLRVQIRTSAAPAKRPPETFVTAIPAAAPAPRIQPKLSPLPSQAIAAPSQPQRSFELASSQSATIPSKPETASAPPSQKFNLAFSGEIILASAKGSDDRLLQTSGDVAVDRLVIGEAGSAQLNITGGKLEAGEILIGEQTGSHGEMRVAGGEVVLTSSSGGLFIGGGGSGKLSLGNDNAPGWITSMNGIAPPVVIGTQGRLEGWGGLSTGGSLVNNGVVVGDGHDHTRALDLSKFKDVQSTVSGDGAHRGWYVQRGGQVKLPPLAILAGDGAYTWGDSNAADVPSLVNSLRLYVHDQPIATSVSITLRTVALGNPLDITLPTEVSLAGLWQVDGEGFDPSRLEVLLHYNELAANVVYPGESGLELLAHEGNEWRVAEKMTRDEMRDLIYGELDGPFDYLAVGVPWWTDANAIASSQALPQGVTPAPEPAAGVMVAIGMTFLLRRRRAPS